jgi:bifunctional enzyme CysN/CysC
LGRSRGRQLGASILIDKLTNATAGAGMLRFSLRRAQNLHWQALDVTREVRSKLKNQQPVVLWFTGLSGAGKSTIANLVEKALARMRRQDVKGLYRQARAGVLKNFTGVDSPYEPPRLDSA